MGIAVNLLPSWETCVQDKKQQLELDMKQRTGLKWGKKVHQGCMLSPCLFNVYAEYIMEMTGPSWAGWNHKLGSRLLGEISTTSDMQMISPSRLKVKILLMRVKEQSEKAYLKLNFQKMKIMASHPITSWNQKREKWKQWHILFSWAPNSLWTVTAARKVKEACSLEGKLRPTQTAY